MPLLKLCLVLAAASILPGHAKQPQSPVEIRGVVQTISSNTPVPNIYLYITEGEEEAMTNANGEFRITTWKKLPVVLTTKDVNYQTQKTVVSSADKPVIVKIRKK